MTVFRRPRIDFGGAIAVEKVALRVNIKSERVREGERGKRETSTKGGKFEDQGGSQSLHHRRRRPGRDMRILARS